MQAKLVLTLGAVVRYGMTEPNDLRPDPFIACVDAIGDVWTFLVLREVFFGAHRFREFVERLNISRPRLTERLNHLTDIGALEKQASSDSPAHFDYRLTEKGHAIFPIALALIEWAHRWRDHVQPPRLIHKACGHTLRPEFVCRHCEEEILPRDIRWLPLVPLAELPMAQSNVRGWRRINSPKSVSSPVDPALATLMAFGDRWSMLIMYGAQQVPLRFRDAQSKLGLAHNILSDRFKTLVREGLLMRGSDKRQAPYLATKAGYDLQNVILAMRTWGYDHLTAGTKKWASVQHGACGEDLTVTCRCTVCKQTLDAREVTVERTKMQNGALLQI